MDASLQRLLIKTEIIVIATTTIFGYFMCDTFLEDPAKGHIALLQAFLVCLVSPALKIIDLCLNY
jgi:hypothetical protein